MTTRLPLGNVKVVKVKKPQDQKINLPNLIEHKEGKLTTIYYYEKRKSI